MNLTKARIALVFDWMTNQGGAEKVNLLLHRMFPTAPIFTSIFNKKNLPGFEKAEIHTSFIQKLPFAKKRHQLYLNFMPYAYEQFDLSNFDIVISSSHACAKGIITKPETLHVCYCHTPMRYAWDNWQTYIKDYKANPLLKHFAKKSMHKLRMWDRLSAERVDYFLANSETTKKRISKYYKKSSTVLNPPIKVSGYKISENTKGYFLAVGRLIPYKKFDLLVETFNQIGLPLKIAGTGIMERELRAQAKENIDFLGYVNDRELKTLYSEAEALLFPQLEDFGLTAVESMAAGRPVIAYGKGGSLDSVIDGKTGILFDEQTPESLKDAIEKYQRNKSDFIPLEIRKHAENFDQKVFEKRLMEFLKKKWDVWQGSAK